MLADKTRRGIIAGGNWIIDHIKLIEIYPQEERLANIHMEFTGNGGSPFSVLVTLFKMETNIPLEGIGVIGDDENGKIIREECNSMHINSEQLKEIKDVATSYTDVMTVRSTGKRTFFHYRGTNALLSKTDFDFSNTQAKLFHFGYLLLLDGLDTIESDGLTGAAHVLKLAKSKGLWTSVDIVSEQSNRYKKVIPPALPYVDFLFLNEFETEMLIGECILDEKGILVVEKGFHAAQLLLNLGVLQWVIIHFSGGAIAMSKTGEQIYQRGICVPMESIKGTVGAGDAFAAGVLAGIHENWNMEQCLVSGVSVAASSLQHVTSTGSIRSWKDCMKLGTDFGWRS